MRTVETSQTGIDLLGFIRKRLKKYYPHYLFSFVILFLYVNFVEWGASKAEALKNFFAQSIEIFMLHGTILTDETTWLYNSASWYLSVLLLVSYVLIAMLNRRKSDVILWAPVILLEIYTYMAYTLGTINNWRTHVLGILNYGILRGIAGMLIGVLIWHLSTKVSRYSEGKDIQGANFCLIAGAFFAVSIPILSFRWFHRASFLYVGIGALAVFLFVVGESKVSFSNSIVRTAEFCSRITYAIYLNHYFIMRILMHTLKFEYRWEIIPIYLGSLIIYSTATTWLVQKLEHCIKTTLMSLRANTRKDN